MTLHVIVGIFVLLVLSKRNLTMQLSTRINVTWTIGLDGCNRKLRPLLGRMGTKVARTSAVSSLVFEIGLNTLYGCNRCENERRHKVIGYALLCPQ